MYRDIASYICERVNGICVDDICEKLHKVDTFHTSSPNASNSFLIHSLGILVNVCVCQISRLEGNLQSLQMNLASAHQKYKTDGVKMEEEIKRLSLDLSKTLHDYVCMTDTQCVLGEPPRHMPSLV